MNTFHRMKKNYNWYRLQDFLKNCLMIHTGSSLLLSPLRGSYDFIECNENMFVLSASTSDVFKLKTKGAYTKSSRF